MKTFNTEEFTEAFLKIGICEGDNLLVFNSLLKFGKPSNVKIGDLPEQIFNQLIQIIGEHGTIAVPTFNFDFCKGIAFNRQETPSKNMGVFSEFVRKKPQAKRSSHPMQSLAAIGRNANYLVENDFSSSFSVEGPFERLIQLKGKILLLGADINAISLFHCIEEKYAVPYRYWKSFSGTYIDNEIASERTYQMYVKDLEANPVLTLLRFENEFKRTNKLKEVSVGGGLIKVIEITDFIDTIEKIIKVNPYYFVTNHPEFEVL